MSAGPGASSPPERPWEALPPETAAVLAPELPRLTDEIISAVAEGVPEYARPIEGPFGRGLRVGVEEALRRFLELIERPDAERGSAREIYVGLGRGEVRAGRPLDALLGAYRLGARVAWRRLSAAGVTAGLAPEVIYGLAEAIFAYIDELSAESAEGYAEEQLAAAGETAARRRRLVRLLVQDPPPGEAAIAAAARDAGWTVPRSLAVLALAGGEREPALRRLPHGAVAAPVGELVCAIVPDLDGPGRRDELTRALAGAATGAAALGPVVVPGEAAVSFTRAAAALELAAEGLLAPQDGLIDAARHGAALLLHRDRRLARDVAAGRLAPFDAVSGATRARLLETLNAWLRRQGRLTAVAEELGVHPQTVRYRLGQLRDLLGEELEDPDARFELELALRISPPGT